MTTIDLFTGEWTPDAVVFDCDGLLMDTESCWTVAETEIFARHGLPFGPQEKALVIGRSISAAADNMAVAFRRPDEGRQIEAELLALVTKVVGDQADPMDGAVELVHLVRERRPVAVASNSPRALLDLALRRGGLEDCFPVSLAADEVSTPKPAPDMYLETCRRLGTPAAATLAFEDSRTGVRSAVAAGVRVVGVPTLHVEGELPADVVVPSLRNERLLSWVRSWT